MREIVCLVKGNTHSFNLGVNMETKGVRITLEEYEKMKKLKRKQEIKQARDSAYYKQYPWKLKEKAEFELKKLADKEANKHYSKSKLDKERAFWYDSDGMDKVHRSDAVFLPSGQVFTKQCSSKEQLNNLLNEQRLFLIVKAKECNPMSKWPKLSLIHI